MKVQGVFLQALKDLATLKMSILNLPLFFSPVSMNGHDVPAKTPPMASRSLQDPIPYPTWAQGTTGWTAVHNHTFPATEPDTSGGGAGAAAFSWELAPTHPRHSTRRPARSPGQHPARGGETSPPECPRVPAPFPVSLRRAQPLGDLPPGRLMKGRPMPCLETWPVYWN